MWLCGLSGSYLNISESKSNIHQRNEWTALGNMFYGCLQRCHISSISHLGTVNHGWVQGEHVLKMFFQSLIEKGEGIPPSPEIQFFGYIHGFLLFSLFLPLKDTFLFHFFEAK